MVMVDEIDDSIMIRWVNGIGIRKDAIQEVCNLFI